MSDKKTKNKLQKARKQYIAKRNDMIRLSRQSLTLVQNKAISYIFSKVRPTDQPGTVYKFDCQEFYDIMRWNKNSYYDLRVMLYSLAAQTFGIYDELTKTEKITHWFNTIHLRQDENDRIVSDSDLPSRYIEITIHEDLWDYLYNLDRQRIDGYFYSTYQLQSVSLFKHVYSQHLYELLKTYESKAPVSTWRFEYGTGTVNDLQLKIAVYTQRVPDSDGDKKSGGRIRRMSNIKPDFTPIIPSGWSKFSIFEKQVLIPCREEINRYTDIEFDYAPSKVDLAGVKRRKYSSIQFTIRKKSKAQKIATDDMIDDAYAAFDAKSEYRQLSISDYLADLTVTENEEEARPSSAAAASDADRESVIEKAEYKIAASVFYDDFKQNEITYLVRAAMRHVPMTRVKRENREMWAIDFISYYHEKIKATSEDTKTTTYRRLLDAVTNDYDDFADTPSAYDETRDIEDAEFEKISYGEDEPEEGSAMDKDAESEAISNERDMPEESTVMDASDAKDESDDVAVFRKKDIDSMSLAELNAYIAALQRKIDERASEETAQ